MKKLFHEGNERWQALTQDGLNLQCEIRAALEPILAKWANFKGDMDYSPWDILSITISEFQMMVVRHILTHRRERNIPPEPFQYEPSGV